MSFGFAVGDFIAAAKLIKDIVSILRTAARAEYQELVLELRGLQNSLNHVERLRAPPERQSSITSIKVAALTCTHVLDEFVNKLRKFEDLSVQHGTPKAKLWTQKLRWGFTMGDEVQKLRSYLLAHVGYLNMRLVTEGLSSTYLARQSIQDAEASISRNVSRTLASSIQSNIKMMSRTITSQLCPPLDSLIGFMNKIWQSNMKIIGLLTMILERPTPTLQYTWFQAPIKFEDALGRVLPIPSEFDWLKLEAIIFAQFASGPGTDKVKAGEYELFDPLNRNQNITKGASQPLRPGMSITMAFIIGKYGHNFSEGDRCLRPGCLSREFRSPDGNERQCIKCNLCFDKARTVLPQPHRASFFAPQTPYKNKWTSVRSIKRKRRRQVGTSHDTRSHRSYELTRNEQMCFKNIRIVYTPLPQSPHVKNIRHTEFIGSSYTMYLKALCHRRRWADPCFQSFRTPLGYGGTVRVNNRGLYRRRLRDDMVGSRSCGR
ncbi:hypothetical protein DE146DRAFT_440850 [Phaeosphaeria sp. MPI-PUGE-AT-0046c]|nr:hypothetical protein DE146DRAFT_440850 [Phaeosphaeria sp. MPI-PUGE-AT-0046c]